MTAEPIKVSQFNLIAVVKFKFECMFVFCFFSNSFVTCHKEIGLFLQYCLSYGVAVTKNYFVCRTESLQRMDFLFVNAINKTGICCLKMPKCGKKEEKNYWPFLGTSTNLVCHSD